MKSFLAKNLMIVVSIALPLLVVVFLALSAIAMRINKRYISNADSGYRPS